MSAHEGDCCESSGDALTPGGETRPPCPKCRVVGRVVTDATIEAILKAGLAKSLLAVERRFCRTPGCEVLYYGADGRHVGKTAARGRVGLKESADPVPLCYCFGFSRADVSREVALSGASTIPAQITARVRAALCECEVKNPSGVCCLGEVNRAVKTAFDALRNELHPKRTEDSTINEKEPEPGAASGQQ